MKYYFSIGIDGSKDIIRIDLDGTPWVLGLRENDPYYQQWLSEGNSPEEYISE